MPPAKLLDQVSAVLRLKHFSLSTERAYVNWIKRLILYQQKRHPREMGELEMRQFISHLAVEKKIPAATQTVAPQCDSFSLSRVDEIRTGSDSDRPKRLRILDLRLRNG